MADFSAEKDWVEQQLQSSRAYRSALIKEVKIDVEMYRQKYRIAVPADFVQVKSPTTRSICDRAADRLGSGRFQIHMEPRPNRRGKSEKDHVESMEQAAQAILFAARRRARYNPIRGMALHAFNRGAFVPKFQVDLKGLEGKPTRKQGESAVEFLRRRKKWDYDQLNRFPLLLDVRPIESIFPDAESDGDNWVIEHYLRRVGDIKRNYPAWEGWSSEFSRTASGSKKRATHTDEDFVTYTEAWTCDWRGVMVEDDWIPVVEDEGPGPVDNLLGRPPYWIRYAGFGDPSASPEERCVSILRGVRDTAKLESRLLTVIAALAENEAYGSIVMKTDDTGAAGFSLAPGAINEMDNPELVKSVKPENNLRDALAAMGLVKQLVDAGAVPSEARGAPSPSRSGAPPSGVAAAILTGQASMILDPVIDSINAWASEFVPFCFYVVDNVIEEPIEVAAQISTDRFVSQRLDSKLIDGHYGPVFAELKLRAPEDDYAKWNLGIQAIERMGPHPFIFEKFFGIENAEAFVEELQTRQIVNSETIGMLLQQRLAAKLAAKWDGTADPGPGSQTAAPASSTAVPDPSAPPTLSGPLPLEAAAAVSPQGNMPLDARVRASMGVTPGPGGTGGPVTAPAQVA